MTLEELGLKPWFTEQLTEPPGDGETLARVTLTRARDPKTGGAAVAAYFNDIADRARLLAVPRPAAPPAGQTAG